MAAAPGRTAVISAGTPSPMTARRTEPEPTPGDPGGPATIQRRLLARSCSHQWMLAPRLVTVGDAGCGSAEGEVAQPQVGHADQHGGDGDHGAVPGELQEADGVAGALGEAEDDDVGAGPDGGGV